MSAGQEVRRRANDLLLVKESLLLGFFLAGHVLAFSGVVTRASVQSRLSRPPLVCSNCKIGFYTKFSSISCKKKKKKSEFGTCSAAFPAMAEIRGSSVK